MEQNTCKNCNTRLEGKFCHNCGQKNYTEKDKNLKGIFEEALHFMTHFDGTMLTTFRTVLLKPGKLSLDYCNGIRKKYYKPISFFLLLIVIYLVFPFFEGLNMRLPYYKYIPLSGHIITQQIEKKVATKHITEMELEEQFHEKSEKTSKVLLLLLIPLTAGALRLMYFYKKYPAFDYFILATEINIFTILLMFLLFPLLLYTFQRTTGLALNETAGLTLLAVGYISYIAMAIKQFFNDSWIKTFGKTLLLLGMYEIVTQIIYKTILFEVTFALL